MKRRDGVILLGKGDGTFETAVNYGVGETPTLVRIADLNGDGKLDLVIPVQGVNATDILLGNGDGTFQRRL